MTARENGFESRLRFLESEFEGEKALTRHLFKTASGNVEDTSTIRVGITTLRLQAERVAGNIDLVKTMQVSQGTVLNVLAEDVREIRTGMGHTHTEMSEMRMEMGEMNAEFGNIPAEMGRMRTEIGDVRAGMGDTNALLFAMERSIDARFDAMQSDFDAKFDAVLAAIRTIVPPAPPTL